MFDYTRDKAVEALRSGSKTAILEGLIPVVMAGGGPDRPTGGTLLSILLHSAEKAGLDAAALFAYGAQFAADEEAVARIRGFPSLPPEMRCIARFGMRERRTPDGLTYEHAVEAMARPRWWDKLLGRRRVSKEKVLEDLRRVEERYR
jgi:hypothetical protein